MGKSTEMSVDLEAEPSATPEPTETPNTRSENHPVSAEPTESTSESVSPKIVEENSKISGSLVNMDEAADSKTESNEEKIKNNQPDGVENQNPAEISNENKLLNNIELTVNNINNNQLKIEETTKLNDKNVKMVTETGGEDISSEDDLNDHKNTNTYTNNGYLSHHHLNTTPNKNHSEFLNHIKTKHELSESTEQTAANLFLNISTKIVTKTNSLDLNGTSMTSEPLGQAETKASSPSSTTLSPVSLGSLEPANKRARLSNS